MNSKAWKMSASVIIGRPPILRDSVPKKGPNIISSSQNSSGSNLHILSLRRGETDKHLPGTHVFPGGHLDDFDKNPAWIDLYKSFGYGENSFLSLSTDGAVGNLPEYRQDTECIPGWMSLRLCAIRETFEECGILLCRTPSGAEQGLPFASFVVMNELSAWQSRVRADPRQMLALCTAAGCVPDLWGLHLWSHWLTPAQQRVRHNSTFFLAVLQALPPHSLNLSEMDDLKWCSPLDLIEGSQSGKLRLANPQFYEASRLSGFNDAAGLALFASNRARHGCACNMPVQEMTKDGMLFLLPGDSAYPYNVDYETSRELIRREESLQELREKIINDKGTLHRTEIQKGSICQQVYVHNYVPLYQHIAPSTKSFIRKEIKSQL